MCSELVSPHDVKNDVSYTCSAFFWLHGLKNDICFMCSALVSPHGLNNDGYYMCKVFVSRHWHVTCVALFFSWFENFQNTYRVKVDLAQNELPVANNKRCFLDEQSRAFEITCSSVVGFRL